VALSNGNPTKKYDQMKSQSTKPRGESRRPEESEAESRPHPPRPHRGFLVISALLLFLWLCFLAAMAIWA